MSNPENISVSQMHKQVLIKQSDEMEVVLYSV